MIESQQSIHVSPKGFALAFRNTPDEVLITHKFAANLAHQLQSSACLLEQAIQDGCRKEVSSEEVAVQPSWCHDVIKRLEDNVLFITLMVHVSPLIIFPIYFCYFGVVF